MPTKVVRTSTERAGSKGARSRRRRWRVRIPISDLERNFLVAKGYLAPGEREKTASVKHAIEAFLSDRARRQR